MKSNSISTYWAKNVRIDAIRGNGFEFSLNIKNSDGSDYEFAFNDKAFFGVYKEIPYAAGELSDFATSNNGAPLYNNQSSGASAYYTFNTSIEGNTIKVSAHDESLDMNALLAAPGVYKYVLFTYNPSEAFWSYVDNFMQEVAGGPNSYLNVEYIHPDATQVYTFQEIGYQDPGFYHQWYLLPGDEDELPYCTIGDVATLQANTYEGATLSEYTLQFPFNQTYYADSHNIWAGNSFTYKSGISELTITVGIQQENIVKCLWPELPVWVEPSMGPDVWIDPDWVEAVVVDPVVIDTTYGPITYAPNSYTETRTWTSIPSLTGNTNIINIPIILDDDTVLSEPICHYEDVDGNDQGGVEVLGSSLPTISGPYFTYEATDNVYEMEPLWVYWLMGTPWGLTKPQDISISQVSNFFSNMLDLSDYANLYQLNPEEHYYKSYYQELGYQAALYNLWSVTSSAWPLMYENMNPWGTDNYKGTHYLWVPNNSVIGERWEYENNGPYELPHDPLGFKTGFDDSATIDPGYLLDFVGYTAKTYFAKNSQFFGFVDYDSLDDAQALATGSPIAFISNMVDDYVEETFDPEIEEGYSIINNIYFPNMGNEGNNQVAESTFKVNLKASLINVGAMEVFGGTSFVEWDNAVNNQENLINIELIVISEDDSQTWTSNQLVHIDPVWQTDCEDFNNGNENTFTADVFINENYTIYPTPVSCPQNLDVVLDYNPLMAEVPSGTKVKMGYRFTNLMQIVPPIITTTTETTSETITEENAVYTTITIDNNYTLEWGPFTGSSDTTAIIDVQIEEGASDQVMGDFVTNTYPGQLSLEGNSTTDSDIEDIELPEPEEISATDIWDGEFLVYQEGMGIIQFAVGRGYTCGTFTPYTTYFPDATGIWADGFHMPTPGGLNSLYTVHYQSQTRLYNITQGTYEEVYPINIDWYNLSGLDDYAASPGHPSVFIPYRTTAGNITTDGFASMTSHDFEVSIPENFAEPGDQLKLSFSCSGTGWEQTLNSRKVGGWPSYDMYINGAPYSDWSDVAMSNPGSDTAAFQAIQFGAYYNNGIPLSSPDDDGWYEDTGYVSVAIGGGHEYDVPIPYTWGKHSFYWQSEHLKVQWKESTTAVVQSGVEEVSNVVTTSVDTDNQWTQDKAKVANVTMDFDLVLINLNYHSDVDVEEGEELPPEILEEGYVIDGYTIPGYYTEGYYEDGEIIPGYYTEGQSDEILSTFEYKFQLINIDNNQVLYEWIEEASLDVEFGLNNFNYNQWNRTLYFGEDGISAPNNSNLRVDVQPNHQYRRYTNAEEGYMRITKTNFQAAWRNYSYLSDEVMPQIATKLDHWLFGDFIIKNNN